MAERSPENPAPPVPPPPQLAPADRQPQPVEPASTRRARVGSSVREFFVIVVGVLVALAAQAWWEGRQERELERTYLRQLLADARVNEARLVEDVATDSAATWATRRVLVMLEGGAELSPDSLLALMSLVGSLADFRPITGTHRALFSTGDLRLIRSDTVRLTTMRYAASVDNEIERLGQLRMVVLDLVGDFSERVPLMRRSLTVPPTAADVDMAALRRDPQIAALFATYFATTSNRLSGLRRVLADTRELRRLLEQELGEEPVAPQAR